MATVNHWEERVRPVRLRRWHKTETCPHLRSSELLDMFSCLWHSAHSVLLALVSFAALTFPFLPPQHVLYKFFTKWKWNLTKARDYSPSKAACFIRINYKQRVFYFCHLTFFSWSKTLSRTPDFSFGIWKHICPPSSSTGFSSEWGRNAYTQ